MQVTINRWCFNPSLWPSLATIVFFPLLVSLGFWQLDRAEEKRSRQGVFIAQQQADVIMLGQPPELLNHIEHFEWQRIFARGVFEEKIQILLDNQVLDAQVGYYVFTPFKPSEWDVCVLVNRGWVPVGKDRSQPPELLRTDGEVSIQALIKRPPLTGLRLSKVASPEQLDRGIYRVNHIDIAELSGLTGLTLSDKVFRLEENSGHGYNKRWPIPGSGKKKHFGYAFQWFVMAAVLLLMYLGLNIERIENKA